MTANDLKVALNSELYYLDIQINDLNNQEKSINNKIDENKTNKKIYNKKKRTSTYAMFYCLAASIVASILAYNPYIGYSLYSKIIIVGFSLTSICALASHCYNDYQIDKCDDISSIQKQKLKRVKEKIKDINSRKSKIKTTFEYIENENNLRSLLNEIEDKLGSEYLDLKNESPKVLLKRKK